MEQENKQPGKKGSKFGKTFATGLLVTALTAATVGGVTAGLTSCKQPVSPGGNGGNGNNGQQHEHVWGTPVWDSEIDWTYYDGSEGRKGPYYNSAKHKPATVDATGKGYAVGTQTGTQTCTIDKTSTQPVTRTYDPNDPATAFLFLDDIHIPQGVVMDEDGGQSPIGNTPQPGLGETWVQVAGEDWRTKEGDSTKEVKWIKKQKYVDSVAVSPAVYDWFISDPLVERNKEVTNTLPSYNNGVDDTAVDVNVLNVITTSGNGGAAIHNALTAHVAANVIDNTFQQFADQAEVLRTVFAGATSGDTALAADFTALKNAEAAIKTAGSGKTVGQRLTTVDAQRTAILNTIFGASGPERAAFDTYYNAYTKGHYLISADWSTRNGGSDEYATEPPYQDPEVAAAITAAVADFKSARAAVLSADSTIPTTNDSQVYAGPRGIDVPIGNDASVDTQLTAIGNVMKNKIIAALGLTGVANADKMAEALVIQLCQDHEEFRAFVDDITAEGLNVLNYQGPVASVAPQSNVKLAAVNPESAFDPELTKTAYSKPFEKYTGNFTPYKDRLA